MGERRFIIQVGGHLPPHTLERLPGAAGVFAIETVLSASVRDQAALNGLLRRLEDLGLTLVGFRRLSPVSASSSHVRAEVIVAGPVGDLAVSVLEEQADITHVSTRVDLREQRVMDEVLDRLLSSGAEVESAPGAPGRGPVPTPGQTPPVPPTAP